MKTIDTLRTAFILSFTRPILTITNLLLFIFTLIIFEVAPGTVILFISSLLSFLLLFVNKSLLLELDSISKEQNI
ncbi:hypothetical protein [Clostridium sp.]|uniref:hypothetical protein n=1 Tax=Clostridium sp. TaxID=1506 RepID=UPI0025C63F16|nr:hypothetical protein [Clostridium sp.]